MIPAGVVLILATLFLMGMATVFVGYWPGIDQNYREEALVEYMAFEMARMRLAEGDTDGVVPLMPPVGEDSAYEFFDRSRDTVKIVNDGEGGGFTVYVLPEKFPLFPYNYLTSQPSYRGDETGEIRMSEVHHPDRLCPADAPVVLKVGDEDIEKALKRLTGEGADTEE
jgi:hypothetical protein